MHFFGDTWLILISPNFLRQRSLLLDTHSMVFSLVSNIVYVRVLDHQIKYSLSIRAYSSRRDKIQDILAES